MSKNPTKGRKRVTIFHLFQIKTPLSLKHPVEILSFKKGEKNRKRRTIEAHFLYFMKVGCIYNERKIQVAKYKMDDFQQCLRVCNWKEKSSTAPTKIINQPCKETCKERGRHISLTYLTTPPTMSRKVRWRNRVLGVLGAFSKGCPPLTTFILISAIPTSFHVLVKWVYMNLSPKGIAWWQ